MKKAGSILMLLCFSLLANAQDNDGFYLLPKEANLYPDKSITIYLHYAPTVAGEIVESGTGLSPYVEQWTVNGKNIDALSPEDGKITAANGFDLSQVTYTAPSVAPAKNPVAVAIKVKTEDSSTLWLVCNITIAKAQYKITMDAEQTVAEAGQDIQLHGECFANLKALGDGSYMLEPVDKTRNMNVTVEQNKIANAKGAVSQIIFPKQYVFPFLFSIGKMDKNTSSGKATVYLNTTAPQTGTVKNEITAEGKTVTTIADIDKGSVTTTAEGHTSSYQLPTGGNLYAMDAVTHLNLLSGFGLDINTTLQNTNQNKASAQQQMAFAKRMQAHEHDHNYFKTAQGKKDMQQMLALQQQIGGNIKNESSNAAAIRQAMTKKMKDDPNYAGSDQFHQDLEKLQMNHNSAQNFSGKPAMAEVAPGTARIRVEGTFNAKSGTAFTGHLENTAGPMNTTIKITVEKMN